LSMEVVVGVVRRSSGRKILLDVARVHLNL
jgi:hypothetical protein